MTKQQYANTAWLIEAIASNAESFGYDVAGYWANAEEAIAAFAVADDKHRANVGEAGLEIIHNFCASGDEPQAQMSLREAFAGL